MPRPGPSSRTARIHGGPIRRLARLRGARVAQPKPPRRVSEEKRNQEAPRKPPPPSALPPWAPCCGPAAQRPRRLSRSSAPPETWHPSPVNGRDRTRALRPVAVAAFPSRSLHLRDRKSTRLNSSHLVISYAVFCLKKKKKKLITILT